jgi:hypothetical protein
MLAAAACELSTELGWDVQRKCWKTAHIPARIVKSAGSSWRADLEDL